MRGLYVPTIYLDGNVSVAKQTKNLLRGQWVRINDMLARVVNVTEKNAVLWMQSDKMVAVWN